MPECKYRLQAGNIEMPEPERILRMRTVLDRTGLSRSTLYRKMRDGTFPNQVLISEHCRGWRESAINRWIADPVAYIENKTAERILGSAMRSRQRPLTQ
jgi:prophage regulatory protein